MFSIVVIILNFLSFRNMNFIKSISSSDILNGKCGDGNWPGGIAEAAKQ